MNPPPPRWRCLRRRGWKRWGTSAPRLSLRPMCRRVTRSHESTRQSASAKSGSGTSTSAGVLYPPLPSLRESRRAPAAPVHIGESTSDIPFCFHYKCFSTVNDLVLKLFCILQHCCCRTYSVVSFLFFRLNRLVWTTTGYVMRKDPGWVCTGMFSNVVFP